jgi:1-aminocyclopropane-1-carboxylate deaminase/D-cysteine desulfhydrase-like pyridoxal-dependent ACC family enzyme
MKAIEIDINLQQIKSDLFFEKEIEVIVARLDLIHPLISGNKIFKLHYFIEDAKRKNKKTIVTQGGAFSNHLVATANYCHSNGLKSIGLVRGELAEKASHTISACEEAKMDIFFVDRGAYPEINEHNFTAYIPNHLNDQLDQYYFIPEGGFDELGAAGASIIFEKISKATPPTHIITAIGTATTIAGLIKNCHTNIEIIGIPVLKGMKDIENRLAKLLPYQAYKSPALFYDYHFGGYAKNNHLLLDFMNEFYKEFHIPTDFVYTGKMMFGTIDLIKKNHFPPGSRIICLHTGGLQGNLSLPNNTLVF